MSEYPDVEDIIKKAGLKIHPKTLDADGNVISCSLAQAAADWSDGKWVLFKDDTTNGSLSTVFIGQLFSIACYFETMLFSADGDYVQNRYETYAEAKAGHEALKEKFS